MDSSPADAMRPGDLADGLTAVPVLDDSIAIYIQRRSAVKLLTGLSRSTIYLRVAEGAFPAPVSLGGRAVGWLESEIEEWIAHRIAASRASPENSSRLQGNTHK